MSESAEVLAELMRIAEDPKEPPRTRLMAMVSIGMYLTRRKSDGEDSRRA